MRKAINFDIDTKRYVQYTGKSAPTAYYDIRKFLEKNGFIHRQGSGYLSIHSMNEAKVANIIMELSTKFDWIKSCVKQIDVTNVGRQYSLLPLINSSKSENVESLCVSYTSRTTKAVRFSPSSFKISLSAT